MSDFLTLANFACVEYGYKENADLVGALNVLRAGHAQLACGDVSSMKTEILSLTTKNRD